MSFILWETYFPETQLYCEELVSPDCVVICNVSCISGFLPTNFVVDQVLKGLI